MKTLSPRIPRIHRTYLFLALLTGLSLFLVFSTGCGKEEGKQAGTPNVQEPAPKEETPAAPAPTVVAQEPAPTPEPAAPAPEPVAIVTPAQTPAPAPAPTVAEPAAKTAKDLLIGKWQGSEGTATMTIEFKADGTLIVSGGDGEHQMSMTGSYSWTSESTVSVTVTQNDQTHTDTATVKSIDETSLTLSSPNQGKDITLTRVRG